MIKKWSIRFFALLLVIVAGWWMLAGRPAVAAHGRAFDEAAIETARQEGKTVVVKFSARWCIKCMELERTVYEDTAVINALGSKNVEFFIGDITTADMPAAVWMKKHGFGSSVPLTIIYRPDADPKAVVGGYSPQEFLGWIDATDKP